MEAISQEQSKVEVTGFEARHYDILMDIITLGTYPFFISSAINNMPLKEGDIVLDLGAGTGRNSCLMRNRIGDKGKIIGLEIGKEMQEQFIKNCRRYDNIKLQNQRIDEPFTLEEKVDVAFISFVLHGFVQEKRKIIIENVVNNLKSGGHFCILDYNEMDLSKRSFFINFVFNHVECPLAKEFIQHNWKEELKQMGFISFEEHLYYFDTVRLLCAKKR